MIANGCAYCWAVDDGAGDQAEAKGFQVVAVIQFSSRSGLFTYADPIAKRRGLISDERLQGRVESMPATDAGRAALTGWATFARNNPGQSVVLYQRREVLTCV